MDDSGVRMFYTDKLREHDVGTFIVGTMVSPFMMIPPKQEAWVETGNCPKSCSSKVSLNLLHRDSDILSILLISKTIFYNLY